MDTSRTGSGIMGGMKTPTRLVAAVVRLVATLFAFTVLVLCHAACVSRGTPPARSQALADSGDDCTDAAPSAATITCAQEQCATVCLGGSAL